MNSQLFRYLFTSFEALVVVSVVSAQPAPPGVPEPGLVIWGTVVNAQKPAQALTVTSASWAVTDGTKSTVFDGATRPAVRIVNQGGQSYYVLEVPFDTRTFGAIALSDPATTGTKSFELKSANPPLYTLTPTINGALATVRAVDGVNAAGTTLPVSGFSAAVRGRALRVDLSITPPPDPYDKWAIGFFGSAADARAGRTLDPDGDGFNNESEYLAGTDPLKSSSALRILTITPTAGQLEVNLLWQSATNRRYRVVSSLQAQGPFTEIGTVIPSAGATTQASVPRNATEPERFYRVSIAP
jgi:hypothetical protein